MSKQGKKVSYETAMEELKMIISELQQEAVSIDDLSNKANRAAELIKYCRERLRQTEGDLKGLFED